MTTLSPTAKNCTPRQWTQLEGGTQPASDAACGPIVHVVRFIAAKIEHEHASVLGDDAEREAPHVDRGTSSGSTIVLVNHTEHVGNALIVWAIDVGSVQKNRFGWCRASSPSATFATGGDIHAVPSGIAADLANGHRVALGFECPLFVPIAADPLHLTKARDGEGSRSWSAGAGTGALAVGLTQCNHPKLAVPEIVPAREIAG